MTPIGVARRQRVILHEMNITSVVTLQYLLRYVRSILTQNILYSPVISLK